MWYFWTVIGPKNYMAMACWGGFKTREIAEAAKKIVLRSKRHQLMNDIESQRGNEEMTLADVRKRFAPRPKYCFGHSNGHKYDRGVKFFRGKRVYVCGCGKLLPTQQMIRRRETRRKRLEHQVRELQAQIKRMK